MIVIRRTYKQNRVMNDRSERSYNDYSIQLPAKEVKIRERKILRFTRADVLSFCKAKGITPEYLIMELMKEHNFFEVFYLNI